MACPSPNSIRQVKPIESAKAPSALGFFLRDELPLVFDQALTPFDVFAGKEAKP